MGGTGGAKSVWAMRLAVPGAGSLRTARVGFGWSLLLPLVLLLLVLPLWWPSADDEDESEALVRLVDDASGVIELQSRAQLDALGLEMIDAPVLMRLNGSLTRGLAGTCPGCVEPGQWNGSGEMSIVWRLEADVRVDRLAWRDDRLPAGRATGTLQLVSESRLDETGSIDRSWSLARLQLGDAVAEIELDRRWSPPVAPRGQDAWVDPLAGGSWSPDGSARSGLAAQVHPDDGTTRFEACLPLRVLACDPAAPDLQLDLVEVERARSAMTWVGAAAAITTDDVAAVPGVTSVPAWWQGEGRSSAGPERLHLDAEVDPPPPGANGSAWVLPPAGVAPLPTLQRALGVPTLIGLGSGVRWIIPVSDEDTTQVWAFDPVNGELLEHARVTITGW